MVQERLQKIISNAGKASRRVAETWITEGRVAVNGQVRQTLGARADPAVDEITVDGVPVEKSRYRYFALNKPQGFITAARDDRGRDTVADLIPLGDVVLHPVGRLDIDSEGLVIMTSDGNLTDLLTHPRHGVDKEYLVAVNAPLSANDIRRAVRGIDEGGERLQAASISATLPPPDERGDVPEAAGWLLVTLRQGHKREIRRMMAALGRQVLLLRRVRVGPLILGKMGSGSFRELSEEEVDALYAAAGGSNDEKRPSRKRGEAKAAGPATAAALPWNVAIDGPAASGKSSVGAAIAERFGYKLLDTGLMYRALTYAALTQGVSADRPEDCARLADDLAMEVLTERETRILLEGVDVTNHLRQDDVEGAVSKYSALGPVRAVMVAKQRAIAADARTVVVGRDIGTAVLPDAPVKIYLDASETARARRRGEERPDADEDSELLRRQLAQRDALDSTRTESPLRAADDALHIDTTDLTLGQVIDRVAEEVSRCSSAG